LLLHDAKKWNPGIALKVPMLGIGTTTHNVGRNLINDIITKQVANSSIKDVMHDCIETGIVDW
jgi:hypothetical protein